VQAEHKIDIASLSHEQRDQLVGMPSAAVNPRASLRSVLCVARDFSAW
jgi:hypothetical protein